MPMSSSGGGRTKQSKLVGWKITQTWNLVVSLSENLRIDLGGVELSTTEAYDTPAFSAYRQCLLFLQHDSLREKIYY
jgi:hypothetical protein